MTYLIIWAVGFGVTTGAFYSIDGKKQAGVSLICGMFWPMAWLVAIGVGIGRRMR